MLPGGVKHDCVNSAGRPANSPIALPRSSVSSTRVPGAPDRNATVAAAVALESRVAEFASRRNLEIDHGGISRWGLVGGG